MAVAISYVSQSTFKLIFAKLLVPDLAHHALHLARAPPCLGGARNPTSTRHMASGAGGVGAAAPDIVGSPHLHVMRWLSGCRKLPTSRAFLTLLVDLAQLLQQSRDDERVSLCKNEGWRRTMGTEAAKGVMVSHLNDAVVGP